MQNLLSFLPSGYLSVVIAVVAFGIMLGFIRPRRGFGIIVGFIASIILAPVIGAVLDQLPWWLNLLVILFSGLALIQGFAALFIGDRASDTMAGSLAADIVRLSIRALFFPIRLAAIGIAALLRHLTLRGY
jgi:hypothetical protein